MGRRSLLGLREVILILIIRPRLLATRRCSKALEAFGGDVEAFHAAGGADAGVSDGGDPGGESHDGMKEFSTAVVDSQKVQDNFLMEHARTLNDMARKLELERL